MQRGNCEKYSWDQLTFGNLDLSFSYRYATGVNFSHSYFACRNHFPQFKYAKVGSPPERPRERSWKKLECLPDAAVGCRVPFLSEH